MTGMASKPSCRTHLCHVCLPEVLQGSSEAVEQLHGVMWVAGWHKAVMQQEVVIGTLKIGEQQWRLRWYVLCCAEHHLPAAVGAVFWRYDVPAE